MQSRELLCQVPSFADFVVNCSLLRDQLHTDYIAGSKLLAYAVREEVGPRFAPRVAFLVKQEVGQNR